MIIERGAIVDVLFAEEGCLVLTETKCVRLGVVAAAIVALLERPRTAEELHDALEDSFGASPEGRLDEVLDEMCSVGIVRAGQQPAV